MAQPPPAPTATGGGGWTRIDTGKSIVHEITGPSDILSSASF
ncbi:hypothetical protein KKY_2553 [Pelagibacterium halotolerans B2]|uniref:Uncharacterized protein n=1 Tax=Pelagibacterium halotolerans (strain DSM 22347 / JCM 15775 / CGMCC 1.7692 / B2) TaxID=1082931 RepID=G4RAN8_PELHB|nr:hypothetical protein KKY_2553 [Pelagibacterium halotolerans B2]